MTDRPPRSEPLYPWLRATTVCFTPIGMKIAQPYSLALKALHQRLRLLQLKNLFVSRAYGTALSLTDSHVLVELASSHGGLSPMQLASALMLHKVAISRSLAGLTKAGLISSRSHAVDGRSKLCFLTAKGYSVLEQLDENAGNLMNRFCRYLSKQEQHRLFTLWSALCDGMGATPVAARESIHPLLTPGRRQSRAMGLLGASVFNLPDVSSLEWHWLSLIRDGEHTTAISLSNRLQIPSPTGVEVTRRLIRRKLLTSRPNQTDKRVSLLSLTSSGTELLENIERVAVHQLREATRDFSPQEVQELLWLFHRFGADLIDAPDVRLSDRISISVISEVTKLQSAREFLLSCLVAQGLHRHALESVCHPNNLVLGLFDDREPLAVIEIASDGSRVQYAVGRKDVRTQLLDDFFHLAQDLCGHKWQVVPKLRAEGVTTSYRSRW